MLVFGLFAILAFHEPFVAIVFLLLDDVLQVVMQAIKFGVVLLDVFDNGVATIFNFNNRLVVFADLRPGMVEVRCLVLARALVPEQVACAELVELFERGTNMFELLKLVVILRQRHQLGIGAAQVGLKTGECAL